jgi:hypothetical protein
MVRAVPSAASAPAEARPGEAGVPPPAHRRAVAFSLVIALALALAPSPPAPAAGVPAQTARVEGSPAAAAPGGAPAQVGLVEGAAAPPPPASAPRRVPPLRLPVRGPVVRGFEEPAGPYGPGQAPLPSTA